MKLTDPLLNEPALDLIAGSSLPNSLWSVLTWGLFSFSATKLLTKSSVEKGDFAGSSSSWSLKLFVAPL